MDSSFHPQANGQRVFRGACAVLTLVALAQGAAVAVARKDQRISTAPPAVPVEEVAGQPATPALAAVPAVVDPFDAAALLLEDPHPEMAGPAGVDPSGPDDAESVVIRPPLEIAAAALLDVPITDETCLRSQRHAVISHDNVYHTVLGALGLLNDAYRRNLDLITSCIVQPSPGL